MSRRSGNYKTGFGCQGIGPLNLKKKATPEVRRETRWDRLNPVDSASPPANVTRRFAPARIVGRLAAPDGGGSPHRDRELGRPGGLPKFRGDRGVTPMFRKIALIAVAAVATLFVSDEASARHRRRHACCGQTSSCCAPSCAAPSCAAPCGPSCGAPCGACNAAPSCGAPCGACNAAPSCGAPCNACTSACQPAPTCCQTAAACATGCGAAPCSYSPAPEGHAAPAAAPAAP
jgi:hypothetical protein